LGLDLSCRVDGRPPFGAREDVRMTTHKLVGRHADGVGDLEMPCFRFELGDKYRFEDEVTQLFAEMLVIVPVDGVEHFVGFLEDERLECVDGLFAIPGAPLGGAQGSHDPDQPGELVCSTIRHAAR
jgi:hypothetical protein